MWNAVSYHFETPNYNNPESQLQHGIVKLLPLYY